MKIIVDIDNVVCDFVSSMVAYINKRLGTEYTPKDWTVWDFVDSPNVNIEYDLMMKLFQDYFSLGLWTELYLYEDSAKTLQWLSEKCDLIYLTNRPAVAEKGTMEYFKKHNLPYKSTHILKSYADKVGSQSIVFANNHSKAKYAKRLGAELAIDDKPQTIQEYLNIGIKAAVKLEPYNESVVYENCNENLYKCENLTQFKLLVEKLMD